MKREFLKSLGIEGLTDEIIDKIMSENGKDISKEQQKAEKSSQELENLKSQLETKDKLIEESNTQIQKFKEMDIESIKQSAEEWKNKYTEFENQSKADKETFAKQLADKEYDFAVREFANQHKFTNDFVKTAFISDFKSKGLKLEDGKFLGADDYIKSFDEKNPGVFFKEEAPKDEPKLPTFTTGNTNSQTPKDNGMQFNFTAIHDRPKN